MNILTFDVEEWFLEKENHGGRDFKYREFDEYLSRVLNLLDEEEVKATFFCLGRVASCFPSVIKKIAQRGHEVGCHSNEHLWLNTMSPEEVRQDTYVAISELENLIGKKILSYRAPAFSIGEKNKWVFEILAENGIVRDASIFPALRDFGGFSSFSSTNPSIIKYNGIEIKEFPIHTTTIMGKQIVYSGGGYFRFLPYAFVRKTIRKSDYSMAYFHLGDVMRYTNDMLNRKEYEHYYREKGSIKNRVVRYMKTSWGTRRAFEKMSGLIRDFDFVDLNEADSLIDWNQANKISL